PINDNWDWDVSVNRGRSKFGFEEADSVNVSWWYEPKPGGGIYAESPTKADTGTLQFDQTTLNLDFRGTPKGFNDRPLYLGTGLEYRKDEYQIRAGAPVTYTYGRTNNRAINIVGQTGDTAQPGMQGFPGFSPNEAVDDGRHNYAAYLDLETNLSDRFLLGAAVRYED
ncbi:hypothetical protein RNS31_13990, partial [Staphylococcus pseudintermedius]|uniref:hypothetical protein n=1 Tax=Staphylococcus pseudintermedius TaxID=283734 RepID=UPI002888F1D8